MGFGLLTGKYDVSGLQAGSYRIGFAGQQGGYVTEFWDDAATLESATSIVVGESATVSGKNAQLSSGSRISGRVTDADGAGLANAQVMAYEYSAAQGYWMSSGMTQTAPDGSYELRGLRAGTYRLGFSTFQGGIPSELAS